MTLMFGDGLEEAVVEAAAEVEAVWWACADAAGNAADIGGEDDAADVVDADRFVTAVMVAAMEARVAVAAEAVVVAVAGFRSGPCDWPDGRRASAKIWAI